MHLTFAKWFAYLFVGLLAALPAGSIGSQSPTGDGSEREGPVAVGGVLEVADYEVRVLEVDLDAVQVVLAENMFNEPPADGNVFVMVTVAVTYTGSDVGTPWVDLNFKAVGSENRGYSESDADCGVVPNEAFNVPELFTDGTAEFNVCWQVSEEEAPTLVMYAEELFSIDGDRYWFSLDVSTSGSEPQGTLEEIEEAGSTELRTEVALDAADIQFTPDQITIAANMDVTIELNNVGLLEHDFVVEDTEVASDVLGSGDSETMVVNLEPGTYRFYCSIPGHREAGMVGTLVVE